VIQAQFGQPLVVRLHNKGLTAHTFTVFDTGTDVVLRRGESRTVTSPPPIQATSFRFVCRFHDAGGMHGGLSFGDQGPARLAPP
jgi:plastocyanin